MICPNCKHQVKHLFSNWNNPINSGVFNLCEYCATKEQAESSKSLRELNSERKEHNVSQRI